MKNTGLYWVVRGGGRTRYTAQILGRTGQYTAWYDFRTGLYGVFDGGPVRLLRAAGGATKAWKTRYSSLEAHPRGNIILSFPMIYGMTRQFQWIENSNSELHTLYWPRDLLGGLADLSTPRSARLAK